MQIVKKYVFFVVNEFRFLKPNEKKKHLNKNTTFKEKLNVNNAKKKT